MRLIVMRHARADQHGPTDHDRPLSDRGRRDAAATGDWLRARGHLPDRVLCSTALRTRETLAALRLDTAESFESRLYQASEDTILDVVSEAGADAVLVLGHNPGIGAFATGILKAVPDRLRGGYPAAGTLVAEMPGEVPRFGTGTLVDFVAPESLA